MAEEESVSKIAAVDKKATKTRVPIQPNQEKFDLAMENHRSQTKVTEQQNDIATKKSLLDEVQALEERAGLAASRTPADLITQTDGLVGDISVLRQRLQGSDLALKSSFKAVLTDKLHHIDDTLKIALEKAGVEYTPQTIDSKRTGIAAPIERFLGFLAHGQHQLEKLSGDLRAMHSAGHELTPANMLLVQIKVNQVQQEIELFTSLLNKALESTKTIMNVQV